jgi:hypothetical protein
VEKAQPKLRPVMNALRGFGAHKNRRGGVVKNLLLNMVGAAVIGWAVPAGAQSPVTEWSENFEDDALGALPSAYALAYRGNDSRVVASGTDGIDSPAGSAKYAKFVGPKLTPGASSYWFNDSGTNPPVMALNNKLSADFYIDPALPYNEDVYLASTFWVNRAYNGEIGLGYTLLNDGSGQVVFHVTRYGRGHQGSVTKAVARGWYHLEMVWADGDNDGKVDVTCIVTDANGGMVYAWLEPTEFAADATYETAGFQIQAGEYGFVPLRVDNLRAESRPPEGYMAGDFHQHTTFTDGSNPFATVMAKNNEYGLDWWANSEHGGRFNRNAAGPILAAGFDTGAYAQFLDTLGFPILGDAPGVSGGHTNMWRWQTLRDFSFNDVLTARSLYPARPIVQGVEWNVPGHEHCSVGIVSGEFGAGANANAIAQFEYLWDGNDTDVGGGLAQGWTGKNTTNNHAKAVQAVAWMQAHYPTTSWMVPAHPERRGVQAYPPTYVGSGSQGYSAPAFRDLNNAGPDVCFGFESMPGHQKAGGRGGYGTGASGGGTYGGCGYYAALVGGVWDALLGEGRGFWLFASSDFHSTVEDFWPGEYQKTYTYVTNRMDPVAIVAGLRSGNSFVTEGDLVDAMEFMVDGTPMGGRLFATGTVVTVSIRVRDPEGANHCPTNLPVGINTPVLDHIDVIAGQFTGLIPSSDPAYQSGSNATTCVVARFDAVGGVTDSQGITSTAWTDLGGGWKRMLLTYDTQGKKTYFRLRGSNLGLAVAGQTDGAGNPLLDPQGNTEMKAWADLWFYSNPIFVEPSALPVADVKADGSDAPIVVTLKDKVVVEVSLRARAYVGVPVDWWLVASTPIGWYYYNPLSGQWTPGFLRSGAGALVDLPSTVVYNNILTTPGLYRVYFGVDYPMDGAILDPNLLIYDWVDVTVTP